MEMDRKIERLEERHVLEEISRDVFEKSGQNF